MRSSFSNMHHVVVAMVRSEVGAYERDHVFDVVVGIIGSAVVCGVCLGACGWITDGVDGAAVVCGRDVWTAALAAQASGGLRRECEAMSTAPQRLKSRILLWR